MTRTFSSIEAMLEATVEFIEERTTAWHDLIEMIVKDASLLGKARMIQILEAAHTSTGYDRVASGGNGPGRIDSGDMRDAIDSETFKTSDGARGHFGWIDDVLDYYVYQELGSDAFNVNFEGMKALQGAYIEAREKMLADLRASGVKVN